MGEDQSSQDLIPDTLLAFAKDHRYIRQCQDLLQNVLRLQDDDDSSTDLWWGSALLYATLVVSSKGRTLGMEFMGLQNGEWSPWQKRLGVLALAAGWTVWIRKQSILRASQQEEQRHEALRGVSRRYFYQQQRRAMLNRATRSATAEPSPSNDPDTATEEQTSSSSALMGRVRQTMSRVMEVGCVILYAR